MVTQPSRELRGWPPPVYHFDEPRRFPLVSQRGTTPA
jgi:hypothetical protein